MDYSGHLDADLEYPFDEVCFWTMTEKQLFDAAYEMQKQGGHFARAIAEAYFFADSQNRATLVDAFKDLFARYAKE